jgi:hypothetical protein
MGRLHVAARSVKRPATRGEANLDATKKKEGIQVRKTGNNARRGDVMRVPKTSNEARAGNSAAGVDLVEVAVRQLAVMTRALIANAPALLGHQPRSR